ncbi:hypothetical protein ES705_07083 [subsurface metagenome]
MNLKKLKVYRLIFLFLAYLGWLIVLVIMALYVYDFLELNINVIWGYVTLYSLIPVGVAIYEYLSYNIAVGRIQKNLEDLRSSQKFCYSCGKDIDSHEKLITCPNCKVNLNISEFILDR